MPVDLGGQRLGVVAVAVVVDRADEPDLLRVAVRVGVAAAAGAVPGVGDLEGVVAADRIVARRALRAPDVRQRADVGLAVVFVADVGGRAELDGAGGQVVHVLERRLARRDRGVDGGLGLAAAVAGLAHVVEAGLLADDARREGHRRDRRRSPRSRCRACRGRCRSRGRWRSPAPPGRCRTERRSGSPPRRRGTTSSSRRPVRPESQWRAASLAPLKWPTSVRAALLMSTLATSAVLTSVIES